MEKTFSSINSIWKTKVTCKKPKHYLIPYTKRSSKMDYKCKCKTGKYKTLSGKYRQNAL